MRSRKLLTTLALTAVMLAMMTVPAMAYDIDGNLSDWGITFDDLNAGLNDSSISGQTGNESAWVPSSSTADWIVEDNRDSDTSGWSPHYGVHINGTGGTYNTYDEQLVDHYTAGMIPEPTYAGDIAPTGAEGYDIEAMYFDDDEYCNVYFAFVVSRSRNLGDLAIDLDHDGKYEFGIELSGLNSDTVTTKVKRVYWWSKPDHVPENAPLGIKWGKCVGDAEVAFKNSGIRDWGHPNYILEIKVPNANTVFGNIPKDTVSNMHFTITTCGNDHIEREVTFDYKHIPEFTTIAIPVGMIFVLFYFYRRKRQSREE